MRFIAGIRRYSSHQNCVANDERACRFSLHWTTLAFRNCFKSNRMCTQHGTCLPAVPLNRVSNEEVNEMRRAIVYAAAALLSFSSAANAAIFSFVTDPFAGSDALTTPGRQIVGGEDFITFNVATDVFAFAPAIFGIEELSFANDLVENLPASGVNVIVLQTAPIPFAAGIAANLIAAQITTPGPGFFIYFNSGLDLPRLVFSTNLDDNTADLRVLARFTNLTGQGGRDALPTFTAANFALIPEPSTLLLLAVSGVLGAGGLITRRRRSRR